ncbi:MAG: hypothetical protein K2K84_06320 [Muribaculaceae bacterium]|nr:hypothetical protein [Muribaculaceae bacterium]
MSYYIFITAYVLAAVEWGATQWYVLLTVVAAAFIAACARPKDRGKADQRLLAGELIEGEHSTVPMLRVEVMESGAVKFTRLGVDGLTSSGADSLAVNRIGFDLSVKERVSAGYSNDPMMAGARFVMDFLAPDEYYHVHWIDEDSGLWTAFTLHVREGIVIERELRR